MLCDGCLIKMKRKIHIFWSILPEELLLKWMCLAFFFSWNNIPIYIVCVWKGDWVKWKQEIHSCLPLRISVTINTKFLEFSDDRGGGGFPLKLKLIGDYWKWMVCPRAQHPDNKLLTLLQIELSNFHIQTIVQLKRMEPLIRETWREGRKKRLFTQ